MYIIYSWWGGNASHVSAHVLNRYLFSNSGAAVGARSISPIDENRRTQYIGWRDPPTHTATDEQGVSQVLQVLCVLFFVRECRHEMTTKLEPDDSTVLTKLSIGVRA